jgi:exo-beta-1,3-glucanase (GH17 family)
MSGSCIDRRRALALAALGAAALRMPGALARAPAVCARRAVARPALERLERTMARGRFVAYEPTSFRIREGQATPADPGSIRQDLTELRSRFDGLITYGARNGHEAIPGIAADLGFRALLLGVWDPFDATEVEAALLAWRRHPREVLGLSLGNEMIFSGRRRAEELAARIAAVRERAPEVLLSTTEPFHIFYGPETAPLQSELDFLLVNVHPVFQPWFRTAPDAAGVRFVLDVVHRLGEGYCGPVLVKETGVPTAPAAAGFTAARQASFYAALRRGFTPSTRSAFAYFSAYDAPWRAADAQAAPGLHPEEAHWGLYDEQRLPKPVVADIPPLEDSPGATMLPR